MEFSLSLQIAEVDVISVSGDVCWCEPQVLWLGGLPVGARKA